MKTARRVIDLPAVAYALGSLLVAMAALHINTAHAFVFVQGNVFHPPSSLCPLTNHTYTAGGIGQYFVSGSATVDDPCAHGFSSALGDESKGQLKVFDQALEGEVTANSTALLRTGIHLSGPADGTHVTDRLDMAVTGFASGSTSKWGACILVNRIVFSSGCLTVNGHVGDGNFFSFTETLAFDVPVVEGEGGFEVDFSLTSTAKVDSNGLPGIIDISHTAQIQQTLPPGWTFTSDSGLFLTESSPIEPSPIPAPTTALLIGTGLAYLAFLSIARRK